MRGSWGRWVVAFNRGWVQREGIGLGAGKGNGIWVELGPLFLVATSDVKTFKKKEKNFRCQETFGGATSPLYVYKSTFAEDIQHSESNEEIYGVLSFVFWTLTLIPLLKYVFIVLRADDNGEGGTFSLYSLLCHHARVSTLPNCQLADEELSEYKKVGDKSPGSSLKSTLEKHRALQRVLLVLALIGTCMVIGDGVRTPAISVFSAVSGLELSMSKEHHQCIGVLDAATFCFLVDLGMLQK
ncbi:hypothetical protein RHMOL_Rhmol04G0144400 [Rhododendron molle]|uniref:Uncharacterized protein n=1 Tax=Rhododendron molle TaxID=49168 RepID=A0ACC0P0P1_RHOML|nr:hypothetical protein RHMOL_Rhmol04G0144400 [Rhododendron molle]